MELPITFGIEVEFEDGDRAAITADLRRAHLFGWRIKLDQSCGHELVTPILGSYEDFDKLGTALDILKKHGARVTTRCGLHVHYGMQTFSFDDVRRVLAFFVRHESVMFNLVDPCRRDNRYCSRITCRDVVNLGSDAWTTDDDRRTWINGQAHRRHNTVELRLLQGTLDLDTIRGWTFLGLSIVNAAKTKNVRIKGSSKSLSSLLVACGCYRLRGKDPELYQLVAKDWALSAMRLHETAYAEEWGEETAAEEAVDDDTGRTETAVSSNNGDDVWWDLAEPGPEPAPTNEPFGVQVVAEALEQLSRVRLAYGLGAHQSTATSMPMPTPWSVSHINTTPTSTTYTISYP